MRLPLVVACSLLALTPVVTAGHLKIRGKRRGPQEHALLRRGNIAGSTTALNNTADIAYYTNLTLGGQTFSALIDTGSADLWVIDTVPGAQDAGFTASVTYARGAVEGPVQFAPLGFAGQTVQNQAFIAALPTADNPPGGALIGLGPSFGSNVRVASNGNPNADPVLDRIFRQNRTTPNFLSVLLGRSDDPTDLFPGDITVGEILPGYEAISSQPQLPVSMVPINDFGDQHFQILLDRDGIIGPNGVISSTSVVSNTPDTRRATAILDTGFTIPQVPRSVSDAIYSSVPGAQFRNLQGVGPIWTVPCTEEINLAFKAGGNVIFIHPLDTSLDPETLGMPITVAGRSICLGAFQPVSFNTGPQPTFDIILGMAFLRNTYSLFNFGDFVQGGLSTAPPFIQLLATTNDTTEAHNDFVTVRLGGRDNGRAPFDVSRFGGNNSPAPATPSMSASSASRTTGRRGLATRVIIIIVAASVAGAAIIFSLLVCACGRCRRGNARAVPSYMPSYPSYTSYAPLQPQTGYAFQTDAAAVASRPSPGYQK